MARFLMWGLEEERRVKTSGVSSRARSGVDATERNSRASEDSKGLDEERSLRSWLGMRRRTSVVGRKDREAAR